MKQGRKRSAPAQGRFTQTQLRRMGAAVCVLLIAGVLSAVATGVWMLRPLGWEQVASVDGEPVTAREFRQQILLKRGEVAAYFRETYGAGDSPDFWTRDFGGEIPAEVVRAKAMEETVRMKVQLMLAREAGLVRDIGYNALLRELKSENSDRSRKIASREVVYGLSSFTEQTYPAYRVSQLAMDLRDMDERENPPPETQLRDWYASHKDPDYVSGKSVTVEAIRLGYENSAGNVDGALRRQGSDKAGELLQALDAGGDFTQLARRAETSVQTLSFSLSTARRDANMYPELRKAALSLNPGEVSRVTEDAHAFWILRCVDGRSEAWYPYEEVRDKVLARVLDDRYETRVRERQAEAVVKINTSLMKKIPVRE